ncbi:MAG: N-acetylmuramoyl-L-alanine amidase [Ahniella sp.]|nr:N-acetylmuramoyl-L-alanine amidase [Ahniella sp.]
MPRFSLSACVCTLIAVFGAGSAVSAEVSGVRLWDAQDHTRIVLDLDRGVQYKVFTLATPDRLVLDISGAKLGKGVGAITPQGPVKGLRAGAQGQDLRVVLDLSEAQRAKSFLLPPAAGIGHRLVIDLFDRDEAPAPVLTVPDLAPANDQRKVIVAIDAGHGGEDPGALGPNGSREKNITLAIAKELAEFVDQQPGMKSFLIRDRDFFVPLKKRYELAREAKADLFVSIHADAAHASSAKGSSVFVLSNRGASSEFARMIANQENQSDLVGGVSIDDKDTTLAKVLLDLSQGATMEASEQVANNVLNGLKGLGNVHKHDVQRANFVVLRSPDVPSILVETAFISNPVEEKRLNDPKHRTKLALALVDGIREHFATTPPQGTWFAANPQKAKQHIVSAGESLSLIAQRHQVSIAKLRSENSLKTDTLHVGKVLKIPTSS